MERSELVKSLRFGEGVAESESSDLSKYFVETDQWNRVIAGEIDIVYGHKGSGKSALYTLLLEKNDKIEEASIISAENPRGDTAFQNIEIKPPTSEVDFQSLWKLYFVSLVGLFLQEAKVKNNPANELTAVLRRAGFLEQDKKTLISRILDFINKRKLQSLEGMLTFDPNTGMVSCVGKASLEGDPTDDSKVNISIDQLITYANQALRMENLIVWIAIDRLDVAFKENHNLEENALRALFHCYLSLLSAESIKLKIFLRTDIWKRITEQGFREASHITRHVTIDWSEAKLLNLIMRRILINPQISEYFGVNPNDVLSDYTKQQELFYRIFPKQVDLGPKKPETFKWMVTRCTDGTDTVAPRELIQLLNQIREEETRSFEMGQASEDKEPLFSRTSVKEALPQVSRTRLHQTLYAEFPKSKPYIEKLEGEKAEHTLATLKKIWSVDDDETEKIAIKLTNVGFFEKRGNKDTPTFWIPFLYRPALNITQGRAE
ncbi:MAG: hypothetical protein OQJ98_00310 [Candidatus Pacebacteria bacterium]|nr:hypothetical protein [Candidatus Paceibacterota bacterium]